MTKEEIGQIISRMSGQIDPQRIRLETERLLLRPLNPEDLMDIHEICVQKDVARMAGWQPSEDLQMSQKRLEEYIQDGETLAVVLKDREKVIGTISLQKRPWHLYPINRELRGRELGFDLHRSFWGRGLMPEAVAALKAYCFQTLGYDFLTAGHFEGNHQSRRAIEKSGFVFLFSDDRELPDKQRYRIHTYIDYNSLKGDHHV